MFPYLFLAFLVALLAVDFVFLPRASRRAWLMLVAAFGAASTMALFPGEWGAVAHWLGVGRPVDVLIYAATALLVREMFLARARYTRHEAQITELVRALAIERARVIEPPK